MTRPASAGKIEPVRHDRESFFLAAYALLAECGYEAVTVPAICDRVGVTKGSFYHHFTGLPDFIAAFADRWQSFVEDILTDYLAQPDAAHRLELMMNSHIALMVGAEPAIRAWGRTDPTIGAAVHRVDIQGRELGRSTYLALVGDDATAEILSRISICAVVGMQQRAAPVDPDRFVRALAEFSRSALHLQVSEVFAHNRLCVKVHGRTDDPIPRWCAPQALPVDGTERTLHFDRGVSEAVAALHPNADQGRPAWFQAARTILAERGSDGLTVAALCARLRITKGAFHHHFATMSGFVAAMAAYWESSYLNLFDCLATQPDPCRRLEAMYQGVLALPRPEEAAWRSWGATNSVVAGAVHRVDQRSEDLLVATLCELGEDPPTASLVAEFGLGMAIGLQLHNPPLDAETVALTGLEWLRRCAGLDADLVLIDGIPQARVGVPDPVAQRGRKEARRQWSRAQ